MENKGTLWLIPVTIGENTLPAEILPPATLAVAQRLRTFIVENEKSARRFLKSAGTKTPMPELKLFPMGKHADPSAVAAFLKIPGSGEDVGVLSEAGCPGIADPGAEVVREAHRTGIKVVPLTGPSSLFLSLMASGMNGQQFHFHGYLPIDKNERLKALKQAEKDALQNHVTHFFIETPFRNMQLMEELLRNLNTTTLLCVACDISLPTEFIRSVTVATWRKLPLPELHKRPAVFLIGK